jgi:peptidoglycan/xylan/chitin deacetylase (PgdA/CDA1 family)
VCVEAQGFAPRRWTAAPVHWLLGTTHIGGLAALAAQPSLWPWAIGVMGAAHALGLAHSFSASSNFVGPVIAQLPLDCAARGEVALTFDDGPDPVITPRVLDILDAQRAQATFFCIARQAQQHAVLVREIVARGHNVENHSVAHSPTQGFYGLGRLVREIGDAQSAIADVTGVLPLYFRPPFGVRTPFTEPALARLGMYCVGWSVRSYDTVDADGARVARRVLRRMKPGSIVLLHDGVSLRSRPNPTGASVLAATALLLEAVAARGGRAVALRAALA